MRRISIVALIIALFIPLCVGGISAVLSSQSMVLYKTMNKPPLSPPGWVFSVAWTILYILMGLASYFIFISDSDSHSKTIALVFYAIQLAMNFMWSLMFFNWKMYLASFAWLMIMWFIILVCAFRFYSISKTATYLFVPYIAWTTFAAYLNLGSYLVNR